MNEIRRIMKTYLSDDAIALLALEAKQDDRQWMMKHGYITEVKLNNKGFSSGGDITPKGERFIKDSNREIERLFEKTKDISVEKYNTVKRNLLGYSKNHYNDEEFSKLSEDEQFAYRKLCFDR